MNLIIKLLRIIRQMVFAAWFQGHFLHDKTRNKKVVVFYLPISGQAVYIAPVIKELSRRDNVSCYLACGDGLRHEDRMVTDIPLNKTMDMQSCKKTSGIDAFISPDQWEGGPSWVRLRICMFHGQPSKGNTFLLNNIKSFNTLFLLGPCVRSRLFVENTWN